MVDTAPVGASSCPAYADNRAPEPRVLAAEIVNRHTGPRGHDLAGIQRELSALNTHDGFLASQVKAAVEQHLTPVERGQLAGATFSMAAPDGNALTFSSDGMTVAQQFAAPAGSPAAQQYARLDRIWGDGNAATNDTAAIDAGLREMIASGRTLEQIEAGTYTPQAPGSVAPAANDDGPDTVTLVADLAQLTLDITGIIEPTPISDGTNAVISVVRSVGSLFGGDLGGAGGHLGNGVLSAVGIIPYLGDAAKLGKIGKWAQTVSDAVGAVASNPALRSTFEPALREIKDLVAKIPQGAIDALPASARESLERMKGQLDEFFGTAARRVDDAGRAIVRNDDGSLNIDAAAQAYADAVATNRPWSWADNFSGSFTGGERSAIRQEAITRGLVTEVPMKPGTRYPDFNAAGLVARTDELPQDLWLRGDTAQFNWLDSRIPGGRPEGYTWHHTETPGKMELVPFGEHNINSHIGGRSPGHWAHAPR